MYIYIYKCIYIYLYLLSVVYEYNDFIYNFNICYLRKHVQYVYKNLVAIIVIHHINTLYIFI